MKKILHAVFAICLLISSAFAQKATEKYLFNQSNTWEEAIRFYTELDKRFSNASLLTYGPTDCGRDLNLFVISHDSDFNPASIRTKNKAVVLINNAIHPGEPDGIDASMKLAENLLTSASYKRLLERVVVCIIPVFNIDGALNRGCCSRANQDGPEEYGFRGNYQNLDLNRDFIKCDAMNTQSFHHLYREWDPDVLIDTHVSDGADYQYPMTLIATQSDKLEQPAGDYLRKKMLPAIYKSMEEKNVLMCPYVNTLTEIPDDGIVEFFESPRFATGYAALFHTFGFVTESHMLKPFKVRVDATIALLESILECTYANSREIKEIRKQSNQQSKEKKIFPVQWTRDTTVYDMISFKGYEAKYKASKISGKQRLYYDQQSPFEKNIRFYNKYKPSVSVEKPHAYIVPQCWRKVIEQMNLNRIYMQRLTSDTSVACEVYIIEDYSSPDHPYEGHYLHRNVKLRKEMKSVKFFKGDYVIVTNQPENRFIVETLEPQGIDSYFAWGFFDAILQGKEYFSSYVFEDMAEIILKENTALKKEFDDRLASDAEFAKNPESQLYFIYQRSSYFEKSFMRYPVARLMDEIKLNTE